MNWIRKNLLMSIVVVAVVLLAGRLLFSQNPRAAMADSPNVKSVPTEESFKKILDNEGTKLLVFDLYADWCPPCRMLSPTIDSLAGKYTGTVGFYRVNVDANPRVAATFGTSGIPYVVFMKNRLVVASLVGLNPSDSYEKIIKVFMSTPGQTVDKSLDTL